MSDNEEDYGYEASCDDTCEVDVILLNGERRENYPVILFNKVCEEKKRIWEKEKQKGPPELKDIVLVLLGLQGRQTVMDDDKAVEYYIDDLVSSKIKFMHQRDVSRQ